MFRTEYQTRNRTYFEHQHNLTLGVVVVAVVVAIPDLRVDRRTTYKQKMNLRAFIVRLFVENSEAINRAVLRGWPFLARLILLYFGPPYCTCTS